MIANTASIRVYRIRQDADVNELVTFLTGELRYSRIEFTELIQIRQGVEIHAFARPNRSVPDWVRMISSYVKSPVSPGGFLKYDFIALIDCKSKNGQQQRFAFFGGSGYHDVADKLDQTFGISVLECVFDSQLNGIKSVGEKGIGGDILASRRFYRRARPVAYEDDFAKYYQSIDVRLHDTQVKHGFPSFAAHRGEKLRTVISVSGSTSVEIRMKVNFIELILLVKDLAELVTTEPPRIFNKTLVPLDGKRDKEQISQLNNKVLDSFVDYCTDPVKYPVDFDFCHRDFDSFFGAATCELAIQGLTNTRGEGIEPIETEDVYELSSPRHIRELVKRIEKSMEYRNADDKRSFLIQALKSVRVVTSDESGNPTTTGRLIEYIQQELEDAGVSYFLLDNRWYRLQNQFDATLAEKYAARISTKFQPYTFIHKWNGQDETAYNRLYDNQPNSFYLHQMKVDHIELCDALVLDVQRKRAFFLYVKDGLGAAVRDLTSQAHMAARIIEEESRTPVKDKLKKLYQQGVRSGRIDGNAVSQENFIQWISSFKREYVLAVHTGDKSPSDVEHGNFKSRIAKYSLIEFASAMSVSGWDFSISCVVA